MSLLEILIAAFLLSMIGIVMADSVGRVTRTKELLVEVNDIHHAARVVLDRMCRELTMAFYTGRINGLDQSRAPKTIFKGEDETPISKLTFSSFSHIRIVRNARESDQNIVSYYGKSNPKKRGVYRLFRREKTVIDAEPDKGGVSQMLLDNVVSLRIRYWDRQKTDWVREWDTERIENALAIPPLVEIKLVLQDEGGKKMTFLTRTKIFMSERLTR